MAAHPEATEQGNRVIKMIYEGPVYLFRVNLRKFSAIGYNHEKALWQCDSHVL